MGNEMISMFKDAGVYFALIISLFAVIEIFKKNGTAKTIGIIFVFLLTLFLLKYLIILVADDINLLHLPFVIITIYALIRVISYSVEDYRNNNFRLSSQEYIKTVVFSEYNVICIVFLFVPLLSLVVNKIFEQPSNFNMITYIEELKLKKVNKELYLYLFENAEYSSYYLLKVAEVLFGIYCCNEGSKGIRGANYSKIKLNLLFFGSIAIVFFISSNWYYEGLKIFFAQFG